MSNINKILYLIGLLSSATFVYAGQGHFLTIYNDSDQDYQISQGKNDCWYPKDLASNMVNKKNSKTFYTEESENFFGGCTSRNKYFDFNIKSTDGTVNKAFTYRVKHVDSSPYRSLRNNTDISQYVMIEGCSDQCRYSIYINQQDEFQIASNNSSNFSKSMSYPQDYRYSITDKSVNKTPKLTINNASAYSLSIVSVSSVCPPVKNAAEEKNRLPCIKWVNSQDPVGKVINPYDSYTFTFEPSILKSYRNGYPEKEGLSYVGEGFFYPSFKITLKNNTTQGLCTIETVGYSAEGENKKLARGLDFKPYSMNWNTYYYSIVGTTATIANSAYLYMYSGINVADMLDLSQAQNQKADISITACGPEIRNQLTIVNRSNLTLHSFQSPEKDAFKPIPLLDKGILNPRTFQVLTALDDYLPKQVNLQFSVVENEAPYKVKVMQDGTREDCDMTPSSWICDYTKTSSGATILLSPNKVMFKICSPTGYIKLDNVMAESIFQDFEPIANQPCVEALSDESYIDLNGKSFDFYIGEKQYKGTFDTDGHIAITASMEHQDEIFTVVKGTDSLNTTMYVYPKIDEIIFSTFGKTEVIPLNPWGANSIGISSQDNRTHRQVVVVYAVFDSYFKIGPYACEATETEQYKTPRKVPCILNIEKNEKLQLVPSVRW
ncbi:hypothetical protein [Fastidiosibacter lacustris]|uniref:hypothetical protein n=1 Tax=Fastidiosibacter lacustris TaxID=2056695 RepID=UPI000E34DBF9|nr:hypothetical protein [Fastidiosibacter lacustris]